MREADVEKITKDLGYPGGELENFACEVTRPDESKYRHVGWFRHLGGGRWCRQPIWGWNWQELGG